MTRIGIPEGISRYFGHEAKPVEKAMPRPEVPVYEGPGLFDRVIENLAGVVKGALFVIGVIVAVVLLV